jgi:uncharacterized membrane protein YgaE (UPF0421/DUF939 family)
LKIGLRIVKTAVGVAISIAIAQGLGLLFYSSAGIVTMLCIQPTRKKSYRIAWERFLACIIGLLVAIVLFTFFGYNPFTIAGILLISIPLIVRFKAKNSVVASGVFVMHLYVLEHITWSLIGNEITLMVVGISVALLFNLFMPNVEQELREYQQKIEENFRIIFHEMSKYLREGEHEWSGMEVVETGRLLREAREKAVHNVENRFDDEEVKFYRYFQMREKQFDVIDHLIPHLISFHPYTNQGEKLADFLDQLAEGIHPGNTAELYLARFDEMNEEYRKYTLPQTEQEFEMRAKILLIMNEIRRYLMIKKSLAR